MADGKVRLFHRLHRACCQVLHHLLDVEHWNIKSPIGKKPYLVECLGDAFRCTTCSRPSVRGTRNLYMIIKTSTGMEGNYAFNSNNPTFTEKKKKAPFVLTQLTTMFLPFSSLVMLQPQTEAILLENTK